VSQRLLGESHSWTLSRAATQSMGLRSTASTEFSLASGPAHAERPAAAVLQPAGRQAPGNTEPCRRSRMATNPFDDNGEETALLVLVNGENQHSLWPAALEIPAGWEQRFEGSRQACLDYVDANWQDIRPASLIARMSS